MKKCGIYIFMKFVLEFFRKKYDEKYPSTSVVTSS